MPLFGQLALWLALLLGVWGAVIGFAGARADRPDLRESARRATVALAGVLLAAVFALVLAVQRRDFQVAFVTAHADRTLADRDMMGALLDGLEGRLLLGAAILAACLAVARQTTPAGDGRALGYATGLASGVAAAVVVVLLSVTNPFALLPYRPLDGQGLDPQHFGFESQLAGLVHCVTYAAAVIPGAWLLAGRLAASREEGWRRVTRTWTLVLWVLLTVDVGLTFWIALRDSAGAGWVVAPLARPAFLLWLLLTAWLHLKRPAGGGYATLAARAGAVLVVGSIVGTSFATSAALRLRPGESASVGPYAFTYLSSSVYPAPNQIITQALIEARRDGRRLGRHGTMRTQQLDLFGHTHFAPAVRPGVWTGFQHALYVRWAADSAASGASEFVVAIVPLARWLWVGLWLLGVAGLAALWAGRGRT